MRKPAPADPAAIKAEIQRIAALSETAKFAEAEARARVLHRTFPARGDVNDALSLVLVDQRRLHDGLPFAKAAVAAEPGNPAFLVNLGRLHLDLEQIEFAAPVLDRAYSLDPQLYQAPWALADFYLKIGKGERAVPYFEQALANVSSEDRPLILNHYSTCLAAMGEVEQAEKLSTELLSDPRFRAAALCRLVSLRKHDTGSAIAGDLRKELENPHMMPKRRSHLLLALGTLYENAGDYREAFRHFVMSRDLLKPMTEGEFLNKDVSKLIEQYTPDVFQRFRQFGHPSEVPVFVVGMPRSGTTLTEQIIASHPQAAGAGELGRILKMNTNLSGELGPQGLFAKLTEVGAERWRQIPEDYLRLLRFLAPDAKRVVDKMPHNFLCLGFIRICFPNARIISCRRHPADSFISSYQNPMKRGHSYTYSQAAYAKHYADHVRLMEHWKSIMADSILEIRYEELVTNPEPVVKNLISFLHLPWDEKCLHPHEHKSTIRTISRLQVKNPINAGSVGRWKNYREELEPLLSALGASSPNAANSGAR